MAGIVRSSVRASGVTDLRGIAQALNDRVVGTARGGQWHVSNVMNIDRATNSGTHPAK